MKTILYTVIKYFHINNPKGVDKMIDKISGDKYKKLESKYEKANLECNFTLNNPQIKPNDRNKLFTLLKI